MKRIILGGLLLITNCYAQVESGLDSYILKTQDYLSLIQNNDLGWDWFVSSTSELRDRTNTSYFNQFGVHGLALMDAHQQTQDRYLLRSFEDLASKINANNIGESTTSKANRCTYLMSTDAMYLYRAGELLGYEDFKQRAALSQQTHKKCFAALFYLSTFDLTDENIDTIPESELAIISEGDIANHYYNYLIYVNRKLGTRLFDLVAKFREAKLLGDLEYARAISFLALSIYDELKLDEAYYLLGLGSALEMISALKAIDERAQTNLDIIIQKLMDHQLPNGTFLHIDPSEMTILGGGSQDNAFIMRGLLAEGSRIDVLTSLVNGVLSYQQSHGHFLFFPNYIYLEGQSELLSALAEVEASRVLIPLRLNFPPQRPSIGRLQALCSMDACLQMRSLQRQ